MPTAMEMYNATQAALAARQQIDNYEREMDRTTSRNQKSESERLMERCSLSLKMADAAEAYAIARRQLGSACLSEASRIAETRNDRTGLAAVPGSTTAQIRKEHSR